MSGTGAFLDYDGLALTASSYGDNLNIAGSSTIPGPVSYTYFDDILTADDGEYVTLTSVDIRRVVPTVPAPANI